MQIGEPKYENERRSPKTYFDVDQGDNVYRILPAIGELAKQGYWSKYWAIHWGYKDTRGKNRPFASPEVRNYQTKMIEVEDAAKLKVDRLSAERDQLKKDMDAAVAARDAVSAKAFKDKLDSVAALVKQFRMEKRHYVNAVTLDGKIGLLKLPIKAKLALDEEVKKLRAKGVSPMAINDGRAFIFSRSGEGNTTAYTCRVYEETIDVPNIGQVKRELVHSLSQDILSRISSEAFELATLYVTPSGAQVASLVSNPSPENVEATLNSLRKARTAESEVVVEEEEASHHEEHDVPELKLEQPAAAPAQFVAPKPAPAPEAPKPAPTAPAAAAGVPDYSSMSNDEFLKMISG